MWIVIYSLLIDINYPEAPRDHLLYSCIISWWSLLFVMTITGAWVFTGSQFVFGYIIFYTVLQQCFRWKLYRVFIMCDSLTSWVLTTTGFFKSVCRWFSVSKHKNRGGVVHKYTLVLRKKCCSIDLLLYWLSENKITKVRITFVDLSKNSIIVTETFWIWSHMIEYVHG